MKIKPRKYTPSNTLHKWTPFNTFRTKRVNTWMPLLLAIFGVKISEYYFDLYEFFFQKYAPNFIAKDIRDRFCGHSNVSWWKRTPGKYTFSDCLLLIRKSLAWPRASKLTTIMYIAWARCESRPTVKSSGLNARSSYERAIEFKFVLDPR